MLYAPWVLTVLGAVGLIYAHAIRKPAGQGPPALFELCCWLSVAAGICLWAT